MSTIASTSCSTARTKWRSSEDARAGHERRRETRSPRGNVLAGPNIVVALLALVLSACAAAPEAPESTTTALQTAAAKVGPLPANTFQILHTNDIHGHLDPQKVTVSGKTFEQGGMALLGGMIRLQRSRAPERTLTLDAGDSRTGTLISAIDHGASIARAMSIIGYDAQTIGNHDLDWGQDELGRRAGEVTFPLLAANLVDSATGQPPPYAKPYIVKDLGIARVGIIGLTYPSATIIKASAVKGLRFEPAIDSVRHYLHELETQADVIVVLSHLGIEGGTARIGGGDTALAAAVPEIDLIIGAHDHLAFRTPHVVGKVKIFQTGAYAENLGRVEVTVDPATKKVASVQGSDVLLPVATGAAPPISEIVALAAERRADADRYGKRVVGTAAAAFAADRDMNAPLGNMVADGLLDYGRQQGWKSDLGFYNAGGIRAPLAAGEITYEKLAEVLPFQNTVVGMDLSGEQVREVLEGMAGSAGRLFMSGGTMTYHSAAPPGQRVVRAAVAEESLDPRRVYHVVTIDYLLGGGDGHTGFSKAANIVYGDLDIDVVSAYLQAHSPVAPGSPGRVSTQ